MMQKNISIILIGLLLLWFSLDITGFSAGKNIFVVSAIIDEPIDILWWFIFIICFISFIAKERIGKYAMFAFLLCWGFIQFPIWFNQNSENILSYNNFFASTHHIIKPSNEQLIKDTYHIILDILILTGLINIIVYIVMRRKVKN